jgi:formiminoglutamase
VRTRISRSVIDVNRDPSGASLYPGLTTTELCPTTTFDGEALYVPGREPDTTQSAVRRTRFFTPYHAALTSELTRLRTLHPHVVLYDAHSIRSHVPRLFAGTLPVLNLGDFDQRSCDSTLTARLEAVCRESQFSWITNGRFKGGWTTRHYGRPSEGVHALQMELADRGYMHEPSPLSEANWPPPYDLAQAAAVRAVLRQVLQGCLEWTATQNKA